MTLIKVRIFYFLEISTVWIIALITEVMKTSQQTITSHGETDTISSQLDAMQMY